MQYSKQLLRNFLAATLGVTCAAHISMGEANETEVQRGEYLVRAGDCTSCHTEAGGAPFSGGASLRSPLGAIFAPNITADRKTGIGSWSDEDFYHALHDGVGKDGKQLYPAMPYPYYTKVTREDVLAMKAYLFSLPPVHKENKQTNLPFPFDIRAGLAVWNEAFFSSGVFQPEPSKSLQYNRGAYLVEGLAHCGDCHTPRGYMLQPLNEEAYSGGAVENWYASNITSDKERGIGSWSSDELFEYLKTGLYKNKGPIVGLMAQVVHESLSYLTDADLKAIVAYVEEIRPVVGYQATPGPALTKPHSAGRTAYLAHCAFCHGLDGGGRPGAFPALAGNSIVLAKGPQSVIRAILGGLLARGSFGAMPAVGQEMTNEEIADAVNYVRNAWGNDAPANANDRLISEIRSETFGLLAMRSPRDTEDASCRIADDTAPLAPIIDTNGQISAILNRTNAVNMLQSVGMAIARFREIAPHVSQAEIINSLTQAYCQGLTASRLPNPEARRLLNRFSGLVYNELVSISLPRAANATPVEPVSTEGSQPRAQQSKLRNANPEKVPPHAHNHHRRGHHRHLHHDKRQSSGEAVDLRRFDPIARIQAPATASSRAICRVRGRRQLIDRFASRQIGFRLLGST